MSVTTIEIATTRHYLEFKPNVTVTTKTIIYPNHVSLFDDEIMGDTIDINQVTARNLTNKSPNQTGTNKIINLNLKTERNLKFILGSYCKVKGFENQFKDSDSGGF